MKANPDYIVLLAFPTPLRVLRGDRVIPARG